MSDDPSCTWQVFNSSVVNFQNSQDSTIFYASLFSCIIFISITRFINKARRLAIITGDPSAAMAVILPSYLPILYAGIVLNLLVAVIVFLFGFLCYSSFVDVVPLNMMKNPWNNILYFAYCLANEWFANSFIFLFCKRSVSYRAFRESFSRGLLFSMLVTTFFVLGLNFTDSFVACQVIALLLPLLLILVISCGNYRISISPFLYYTFTWRVINAFVLVFSWRDELVAQHMILTLLLLLRGLCSPLFIYLVLLRDTHYWRGMPQRKILLGDLSASEFLLHPQPLIIPTRGGSLSEWLAQPRYPPTDEASDQLQNLLDGVSSQVYIDFAFLNIDWSKLLGRGATASVFAGTLTLKNGLDENGIISSPIVASVTPSMSLLDDDIGTSSGEQSNLGTKLRGVDAVALAFIYRILNTTDGDPFGSRPVSRNTSPDLNGTLDTSGLLLGGTQVQVAIKMYTPPELDVATIEAYSQETQILTTLSHPNIVPYLGLCVNPPHLCLVFELCKRGSLEKYLERHDNWSMGRRLSVASDCVRAIKYLHEQGFVHRDIKPGNFLLNDHGRCLLTDFGTCLRMPTGQKCIPTDSIAGSMDHMAPEILTQTHRNMFYGYTSDMFSLGILVTCVFNMSVPYSGIDGSFQIRNSVLNGLRPCILTSLPQNIKTAIEYCLKEGPQDRLTATELLVALEGH